MMKKLLVLILLIPLLLSAQELDADVTVNFEQLPNSAKDRLADFKNLTEDYLNNTRFTELDWEGEPIKCSFTIFFLGSSGETNYSAQAVITSQRPIYKSSKKSLMLNIMDKEWSFQYEKNQSIRFNLVDFDPLTSFLDFYAYLIIGFDMDSYNPLGGSEFFDKAFQISVLGANSRYKKGWTLESSSYNKRRLLVEIADGKFKQFRQDFFDYHYNGLDLFNENRKAAVKNMVKLVDDLYKSYDKIGRNSALLKVFFNAKAGEMVEYLGGLEDDTVFKKLMKINPENISKYEKAIE